MNITNMIINYDDEILVTGSGGFIGSKVVETLINYGFKNIRCFIRPSSNRAKLSKLVEVSGGVNLEIVEGNLLREEDCERAVSNVAIIYHLAAGVDKSFPSAFMNSVVTTRNLLNTIKISKQLKRFVNVSSFAVYSNWHMKRKTMLDETCEIHDPPDCLDEAYVYGKIKQDELVIDYHKKYNIPYVIVRPSVVFGPGKNFIPSRVGLDTFGFFMHLGGSIQIPLTYLDNCADAIILAGLKKGVENQVFNIVDDNLPTSRQFLRLYKKNVRSFASIFLPYPLFYFLCYLWEKYAKWSQGQLPQAFNRAKCATYWKGNTYSNEKLKKLVDWKPKIDFNTALKKYFDYQIEAGAEK